MIDLLYREMCSSYRRERYAARGVKVAVEPVQEPISVDEAALHCRIDGYGSPLDYPERSWLEAAISAARELVEGLSGLVLAPQTLVVGLSEFPSNAYSYGSFGSGTSLLVSPVQGIESVTYADGDGADQTLDPSTYVLDDYQRPAVMYPALNSSWPTGVAYTPNAVRVRFVAGYSLPGDSPQDYPLPKSLKHAMLLVIGHLYENRESTSTASIEPIAMGVTALIERYRIRNSMA